MAAVDGASVPVPSASDDLVDVPSGPPRHALASSFEPEMLPVAPVTRTRLVARMTSGVRYKPLTLLTAPAGSGKTVLAATWAAAETISWPVAWLTVDDACDEPIVLWQCLVESLARAGVDLSAPNILIADDDVHQSFLMALSADLLRRTDPVVLVLDTADQNLSRDVAARLDFLLRHAYPRFRLVLCSRADPELPLHRYRLTDSVSELRREDLAFTSKETEELLANFGVAVSKDVAGALTELTEGWAAGLRLAVRPLQERTDPAGLVKSLARQDGSIAEYLFAEVLDAQSTESRDLLLRTSILERLWPDLVDHLIDRSDGRRTLTDLVRANAFVERSQDYVGAYRVHPLMRELLKAQLAYETPDAVPGLHLRAAEWLNAAGDRVTAAEHAIHGRHWALASSLLIDCLAVGSLLAHHNGPWAASSMALPADLPGPDAAVLRAALAVRSGCQPAEADIALTAAVVDRESEVTPLRVSAAVTYAAFLAADEIEAPTARVAAERADALLSQLSELDADRYKDFVAVAAVSRAMALTALAAEDEFTKAFATAAAASAACGSSRLRRQCLAWQSLGEALSGNLRRANELARSSEQLADECNVPRRHRDPAAPLALAWIRCEMRRHAEARRWVTLARESAMEVKGAIVEPLLGIIEARLLRSARDLDGAAAVIQSKLSAFNSPAWVRERELYELAAMDLTHGRPDHALALVDAMPDGDKPRPQALRTWADALRNPARGIAAEFASTVHGPSDVVIDGLLGTACEQLNRGNTADAIVGVKLALELAEAERIRRPFVDASTELRKLMRATSTLNARAYWLSPANPQARGPVTPADLVRAAPAVTPEKFVLVEPLTQRETEVLRLLSELLSTADIAAAMHVSVNTVRTHIRGILRKLAVSRRNDAIRRARDLALV